VRIISGDYKGRIIQAPASLPVRPTTDFAKTGLFNILANNFDFPHLKVLDLFCGIGSISLEFASRGCRNITCVDEHAACLKFIRETATRLKIAGIVTVRSDAFRFINSATDAYDVVFADPPFDSQDTDRLPDLVFDKNLLAAGGWLVVEHRSGRKIKSAISPIQVRNYGNCSFSIYQNKPS
jgi:16S rRNA (guanine(966)-N(2))-methyltransferase RsmD